MNTKELLSLLTARVQRFQLAPGGIPNLTAQDLAAALGMVKSENACLYARLKYCGETKYAEELAREIKRRLLEKACDESWRGPSVDFYLGMGYLMLFEGVDPHTCPWCDGRAEVRPEKGPVILCDACTGTGRRYMRDTDRAKLLGTTRQNWNNFWGLRYSDMQAETVNWWEDLIGGALRKRIA